MPQNHAAVAALPLLTDTNKTLLRNMLEQRVAYVVDDAAMAADLVATDPSTGATIIVIMCLGRNYLYDSTDVTSVHDGVNVLVTNDGKRYKLAAGSDVVAYSVLDRINTPPTDSPGGLLGDAYLVTSGATGAWSGHSDEIAVYTLHAWEFIDIQIGQLVYVEDEDAYYRKMADGTVSIGFGVASLSADSVLPSQIKGGGARVRWLVENQTTNAPPGVVSEGTAYIIGSSPTGAWSGNAAKIAHGENGAWVVYNPAEGWRVYDKSTDSDYIFSGSAWISSSGQLTLTIRYYTSGTTWNKPDRLSYVEVDVIGGGGGSRSTAGGVDGGTGGTSSFGAHCSATGGQGGQRTGTTVRTGGVGSSGDMNLTGQDGQLDDDALFGGTSNVLNGGLGAFAYGIIGSGGPSASDGTATFTSAAGGGGSRKVIQAASLGASETVTVGAGGTCTSAVAPERVGPSGAVLVREYTFS